MSYFIKIYGVSLIVFLGIDIIWLGFIAKKLYSKYLGYLMTEKIVWIAAVIFYLIFIAGLVFFVINPALREKSLSYALYAGAFLGLVTYATYDLTNLATIKNWPVIVTVLDLLWGMFISSATSGITFLIMKNF